MSKNYHNFNAQIPEIESKIDDLISRMTLEEKIGQTMQIHLNEGNREEMINRIRSGQVGSVLTIYGIDNINAVQKVALEKSRLGIPIIFGNDVIHGYRTIFPIPLAEFLHLGPRFN